MSAPLLSFIVLSYNYQDYIGTTIRSIIEQTVQDFEIVVVDDCSTDQSVSIVRSFGDPRIRLLVNERNIGGSGSYNVAVQAARGTWLVNLDADDWIVPEKCKAQLDALDADPQIDIIGSWVRVVDTSGAPHPQAEVTEQFVNRPHKLNLVENWIGQNALCRSTTMVRRSAHLRIGLDDTQMVRAPDYELWTRALAAGCRFGLVPEKLTNYRLHSRGVTHADPVGTLLELVYAMVRNLAPLAEARALFEAHAQMLRWVAQHPNLTTLSPRCALRLLGVLATLPPTNGFEKFRDVLDAPEDDMGLERIGRIVLLQSEQHVPSSIVHKLSADIAAFIEARDYWKAQAADVAAYIEARDYWKAQADAQSLKILLRRLIDRIANRS